MIEGGVRTFRSGSLKQRTSQPILPYADSPSHSSRGGGKAFKQQSTFSCNRILIAVVVAALLGLATVAFMGVPGVMQPGFRRTKQAAAAQQTFDASHDEHHDWHHDEHAGHHDYHGDDHEEASEQAILDHQIRLEQESGSREKPRLLTEGRREAQQQHKEQQKQQQQQQQQQQVEEQHIDHNALDAHAQQVGELARELETKKQQADLAGVKHEEKGKMHHPEELIASIAEMQKQVPTPAPTPAPTEQVLPQAGDQQQHQGGQQEQQHLQEAASSPAPTPQPTPVPTPEPSAQADAAHADSQQAAGSKEATSAQPVVATGIYALSARDKDDKEVPLSKYAGKVTIVVNVASQCGYTQQNYKGLVDLYHEFKDQGFEVLAFPCNAFGHQEPGSCSEIQHFAEEQFHATFPIFNKIEVNGPDTHPVFKFLKDHTPLGHGGGADVEWNFAKWVVNKKGYPVVRYPSAMDVSALRGWIQYELTRN